jgi:hypothetical protein
MVLIYWLTRLSNIQGLFLTAAIIVTTIISVGLLSYTIMMVDGYESEVKELKQKRKWFVNRIWIICLLWIVAILTPDTKEAMLIIAGGKTMDYVQQDTSLQKIPYKTTELILKKMDEYIDETAKLEKELKESKDTTKSK